MNKILLTMSIALVLLFGAAGVTVAAAQQSQPGEALYPLKTWSMQILHQQEKVQIHAEAGNRVQMRSSFHEQENLTTPQSVGQSDPCNQPGATALCGSDQGAALDHQGELLIQEHDSIEHPAEITNHSNGGTDHNNHESHHEHGGHD